MLRSSILAAVLFASPAVAASPDLTAEVGLVLDLEGGYQMLLLEPSSRPCYLDVDRWVADVRARGYTNPPAPYGYGTNPYTGEYVFAIGVVDPVTGDNAETWAAEDGSDLLCLHAVTIKQPI
jgi:hypothetical protein